MMDLIIRDGNAFWDFVKVETNLVAIGAVAKMLAGGEEVKVKVDARVIADAFKANQERLNAKREALRAKGRERLRRWRAGQKKGGEK